MYQVVFFDLDGTLTDPGLGITNSVMQALKKWEIEVGDRSELYRFIGPPLQESFERFFWIFTRKGKAVCGILQGMIPLEYCLAMEIMKN